MFFGTTPSVISQYLIKEIKEHKPKRVFVPFSGNFVVEQLCGLVDKNIEVHCTDVSIYSRAIGYGLTDTKSEIKLKPELLKKFKGFKGKDSPMDIAAIVVFFSEYAPNATKTDKPFYATMIKDAEINHLKYFHEITKKLEKFKSNIGKMTFYGVDACEIIPDIKKGDLCFYDPPVLLGDYEKMYQKLANCFDHVEPAYTQMTEEVKFGHLEELRKKKATVYYRRNDIIESPKGYKEVYRYNYKHNGFYSIISNNHKSNWVGRFQPLKEEIRHYEMINMDDTITPKSKVVFLPVKGTVANHYRLLWIKKAHMTSAGWSFLIFIDGKLIGMTTVESGLKFGSDYVIIFSDPSSPTSKYKRLSKLILSLITNHEFLNRINEMSMWPHLGFTTRVFTNEPSSMKYRNHYKLIERKVNDTGNWKYALIYHNKPNMPKTIKEGLHRWLQKDGKEVKL